MVASQQVVAVVTAGGTGASANVFAAKKVKLELPPLFNGDPEKV